MTADMHTMSAVSFLSFRFWTISGRCRHNVASKRKNGDLSPEIRQKQAFIALTPLKTRAYTSRAQPAGAERLAVQRLKWNADRSGVARLSEVHIIRPHTRF
jgi:hypothetical protein